MRRISILDQGQRQTLTYEMALAYHGGAAVAGVALGFRAMEAASLALSQPAVEWERNALRIVSGHPGPGVRDAIEVVTRCVTRGRFELTDTFTDARVSDDPPVSCRFDLFHAGTHLQIVLGDGVLLLAFADLLRMCGERCDQRVAATQAAKQSVADRVMAGSIDRLFTIRQQTLGGGGRTAHA